MGGIGMRKEKIRRNMKTKQIKEVRALSISDNEPLSIQL
jgi:hypothetical protein